MIYHWSSCRVLVNRSQTQARAAVLMFFKLHLVRTHVTKVKVIATLKIVFFFLSVVDVVVRNYFYLPTCNHTL